MRDYPKVAPIFEKYSVNEIAERLRLSPLYVSAMMEGKKPLNPKFRWLASIRFEESEDDLFGVEDTANGDTMP